MKSLQALFTTIVLIITAIGFSQTKSPKIDKFEIQEIGVTVNTLQELKSIDWHEVFDIFEIDEENSKIKFYVQLKDFNAIDKNNKEVHFSKVKYEVSGYKNQRKELEKSMKAITKRILKSYKS